MRDHLWVILLVPPDDDVTGGADAAVSLTRG